MVSTVDTGEGGPFSGSRARLPRSKAAAETLVEPLPSPLNP